MRLSTQRRTVFVFLAAVSLVLLLLIVARSPWDRLEAPTERAVLAVPLHPTSVLVFVALERGYFAARGLEVEVATFPSGKLALEEGLFPGRADIAWANEVPVALGGFERTDFRILATDLWADNVNKIVARRDAGVAAPADLRGKRIGTQSGSAVHFFLHLFLLQHQLSATDVVLRFLPAMELVDALVAGEIDAFSMREPYISEAQGRLGDNAVLFEAPGLYEQTHVLVAHQRVIQEKPAVARAVLEAILDAEAFAIANRAETADITADYLGAPFESIAAILPTFRIHVGLSQAFFVLLEAEARWAVQSGLVPPQPLPNYLPLIDPATLERLKPEAVTLIR